MLKRPWSAVVRVPTADGDVWFKEVPPPLAFEPPLTAALAARRPDRVPEPIASEGMRLLTRDAGRRLRNVYAEVAGGPPWAEVVALYAELQVEFSRFVDEALACGTPDRRPTAVPAAAAELPGWAEALADLRRDAEELGDAVPLTVVHEEPTDGNVFVRGGQIRFIDWGEACVSHPFVGALMLLRVDNGRDRFAPGSPAVERLRDAYLEPFTVFAPASELRRLFDRAYSLATAVRALGWHAILSPLDPSAEGHPGDVIGAWLGVWRGIAGGTTRLGDA
jgi:Phosphotransferase enzyme family